MLECVPAILDVTARILVKSVLFFVSLLLDVYLKASKQRFDSSVSMKVQSTLPLYPEYIRMKQLAQASPCWQHLTLRSGEQTGGFAWELSSHWGMFNALNADGGSVAGPSAEDEERIEEDVDVACLLTGKFPGIDHVELELMRRQTMISISRRPLHFAMSLMLQYVILHQKSRTAPAFLANILLCNDAAHINLDLRETASGESKYLHLCIIRRSEGMQDISASILESRNPRRRQATNCAEKKYEAVYATSPVLLKAEFSGWSIYGGWSLLEGLPV